MKKLSQEEVVNRLINKRGTENFDYSKVVYINRRTPIELFCKKHNKTFSAYTESFIDFRKIGCEECSLENERKKKGYTNEQIIKMFKEKHGDVYDYSKVNYVNIDTKISIFCKKHGYFMQTSYEHLYGNNGKGSNCPKCSHGQKTQEEFIAEAKKIFPKYDYSKVNYIDGSKEISIRCQKHGWFNIKPCRIYLKQGCRECGIEEMGLKHIVPFEEFLKRAKESHPFENYEYKNYSKMTEYVSIKCQKHGWFEQGAYSHCRGRGCPDCAQSKGEIAISYFLNKNKIEYIPQYSFDDLKFLNKLKYDFYIKELNTLIEFNGIQHYEQIKYFNPTFKDFIKDRHCDWLKRKYAINNKINLIIIPYWDYEKIDTILEENLWVEKK